MIRRALCCLVAIWLIIACRSFPDGKERVDGFRPFTAVIDFYQGPLDHLSPVRAGECPMYPSCSEYSRLSMERYGALKGWIMTMDRLMRCGRDETKSAPRIWVRGKMKYYDPVENNDLRTTASP